MDITPNPLVIGLQLIPFLVTLLGLHSLIFKPMLAHIDGRTDAIDGARDRAKKLEAQLEQRTNEYQARLTAARAEMAELRASRRTAALAEADVLVRGARKSAESEVEAALATITSEAAVAREGLMASSHHLARQIAGQVLGRPVTA